MELVWANEDFKLKGLPYVGFPILLDAEMRGVEAANRFLRHHLTLGKFGSKKSRCPVGYALYSFFGFLEAHDLDWHDVRADEDHSMVAAYRDYGIDTLGYGNSTIRQYLNVVCEFYKYALKQRWVAALPFGYEDRVIPIPKEDQGPLAHVDASSGTVSVPDVTPKKKRTLVKFLSKDEVIRLIAAADNPHHKMLIRLGVQTGLRREEIATFPLAYVFDPTGRPESNLRVPLNPFDGHGIKIKGSTEDAAIYVSRALMQDLWFYSIHTRGERAKMSQVKYEPLFLNQRGEPYSADGKALEVIVRGIGKKVGIKVWPHMLRHTYATHTLNDLQQSKGAVEPLVYLMKQLRHVSISSTMIYTHLINRHVDNAVLAYDDEINASIRCP